MAGECTDWLVGREALEHNHEDVLTSREATRARRDHENPSPARAGEQGEATARAPAGRRGNRGARSWRPPAVRASPEPSRSRSADHVRESLAGPGDVPIDLDHRIGMRHAALFELRDRSLAGPAEGVDTGVG